MSTKRRAPFGIALLQSAVRVTIMIDCGREAADCLRLMEKLDIVSAEDEIRASIDGDDESVLSLDLDRETIARAFSHLTKRNVVARCLERAFGLYGTDFCGIGSDADIDDAMAGWIESAPVARKHIKAGFAAAKRLDLQRAEKEALAAASLDRWGLMGCKHEKHEPDESGRMTCTAPGCFHTKEPTPDP